MDSRAAANQKGPKLHIKAVCPQNIESSSVKWEKSHLVGYILLSLHQKQIHSTPEKEMDRKLSASTTAPEVKLLFGLSNLQIPP